MLFAFLYSHFCVVQIFIASNISEGGDNQFKRAPVECLRLSWSASPPPRKPTMATEGTQSDVLQRLGVSYSQLIDYSSKEYIAILVSPTHDLRTVHSDRQVQIGIMVLITWDCITTLYALSRLLVRILLTLRKVMGKWRYSGRLKDKCVGQLHVYCLWWSVPALTG